MGCVYSTPIKDPRLRGLTADQTHQSANDEKSLESSGLSAPQIQAEETSPRTPVPNGVSVNVDLNSLFSSHRRMHSEKEVTEGDCRWDYLRNSLHSSAQSQTNALWQEAVGGRLSRIVDERGMLSGRTRSSLSMISNCSLHLSDEASGPILFDELEKDAIHIIKKIGEGGYGTVFLGEYNIGGQRSQVAVKAVNGTKVNDPDQESKREAMVQLEATIMSLASGHPHIVQTYKCLSSWRDLSNEACGKMNRACNKAQNRLSMIEYDWYMIMEYCRLGTMWHAMRGGAFHHPVPVPASVSGLIQQSIAEINPVLESTIPTKSTIPTQIWDTWTVLQNLREVISAIGYLHSNGIIHGDLKAANVLLASKDSDPRGYVAKVADFGFSRAFAGPHILTKTYGTVTHQPPELLAFDTLSPATDIYSFGIMMWEVLTAGHVHQDLSDSQVIAQVLMSGLRPQWPSDTPVSYRNLAEACWSKNAIDRPSPFDIEKELESMQTELCRNGPSMTLSGQAPMQCFGALLKLRTRATSLGQQQQGPASEKLSGALQNRLTTSNSQLLQPRTNFLFSTGPISQVDDRGSSSNSNGSLNPMVIGPSSRTTSLLGSQRGSGHSCHSPLIDRSSHRLSQKRPARLNETAKPIKSLPIRQSNQAYTFSPLQSTKY